MFTNTAVGYSLIDHFKTSSNLIHLVIGSKSLEIFNRLPVLEATDHLDVSTLNTFVKKPTWSTAIYLPGY